MDKELKEQILKRDDVSCLIEYGTPKVKAKATSIAQSVGKKAGMKAANVAVKKADEKLKTVEGLKLIKFAVNKADTILNPPPKKPNAVAEFFKKVREVSIKLGLIYVELDKKELKRRAKLAKKKLKQKEKLRKKRQKSPLWMKLAALLLLPVIEKNILK